MGLAHSPRIATNGLRHCFDFINKKCYTSGSTVRDMITRASGSNSIPNSAVSWMNAGVNEFTLNVAITRLSDNTGYSYNPLSKYASPTDNTFNLYLLGNLNGTAPNNEGLLVLYANRGGIWNPVGSSYRTVIGTPVIATWQINSSLGGQLWINGQKVGGRSGAGILGSNNNTSNLIVATPPLTSVLSMHHVSIYDRELTDAEVKQNFNALRGRYGL